MQTRRKGFVRRMSEIIRLGGSSGMVNCYLVKGREGAALIDTGNSGNSAPIIQQLTAILTESGCPLKAVLLTHGHPDHAGNAAEIAKHFGADIGMHTGDVPLLLPGGMREMKPRGFLGKVFLGLSKMISYKPGKAFIPTLRLTDGMRLERFGVEGIAIHLPGHTAGSMGFLLNNGQDCIGGDILFGVLLPARAYFSEAPDVTEESLARLWHLGVKTLYPGHGKSIPLEKFLKKHPIVIPPITHSHAEKH